MITHSIYQLTLNRIEFTNEEFVSLVELGLSQVCVCVGGQIHRL
jgi:hypothetical protein